MSDSLQNGRKIRLFNVIDDYNREILWVETDTNLPTLRVIRTLEVLKDSRGLSKMIRVDNGTEFISSKLCFWCEENSIQLPFIEPGSTTHNVYIERFNGTFIRDILNAYEFISIDEFDQITKKQIYDYNNKRPHTALKNKIPVEFSIGV